MSTQTPRKKRSAVRRNSARNSQTRFSSAPDSKGHTHPAPTDSLKRDEGSSKPPAAGTPAPLAPGLYITATPIGHAADITLRALDVFGRCDVIACEDTRVTAKLLARHGIAKPMTLYHDHNAARVRPRLLARLAKGEAVVLVSDAGTPLVSDPGYRLVRAAVEAGHAVTALPGPSALLAALVLSGLPSDRFLFAGFLSAKPGARRKDLAALAAVPATLIFLETGPRLAASLADMAAVLGPRPAAVARELTKLHEEVRRGDLASLARDYGAGPPPRGEIVVVAGPPGAAAAARDEDIDARLAGALARLSVRDAAAEVAAALNLPRNRVYRRALALAAKKGDGGDGAA